MTHEELWNSDTPLSDLGAVVPAWIDRDIRCTTLAAIIQGGCSSGAYMPAVTYHDAAATMHEHGDAVLDYIEKVHGDDMPRPPHSTSWHGLAVFYLSAAVELWAAATFEQRSLLCDAPAREKLRQEYIDEVGYDPFSDDPNVNTQDVAATLAEYYEQARIEKKEERRS